MTNDFDPSTLNDYQRAMLERMDDAQKATWEKLSGDEKTEVMAMHTGKVFASRRVASEPLTLPYSRIAHEVAKEIVLATVEQRPDLPKTATAVERYRERTGAPAAPDPMQVRVRIQGLLLDGLLTGHVRAPSGRIYCVSAHAFAETNGSIFDAMERGQPVTVPATPEKFDFDLADGGSGTITGTVYFHEDEFQAACARDPVEIEFVPTADDILAPQATAAPTAEPAPETVSASRGRPKTENVIAYDDALLATLVEEGSQNIRDDKHLRDLTENRLIAAKKGGIIPGVATARKAARKLLEACLRGENHTQPL